MNQKDKAKQFWQNVKDREKEIESSLYQHSKRSLTNNSKTSKRVNKQDLRDVTNKFKEMEKHLKKIKDKRLKNILKDQLNLSKQALISLTSGSAGLLARLNG